MAAKLVILAAFVAVACAERLTAGFSLPIFGGPFVVGGEEASIGQFPHQVSLQWGFPPQVELQHFCGGSILNDQWILTAGHCIQAVPSYGSFVVKAGKNKINNVEDTEQSIVVAKHIVHSKYVGGVAPYDIALVKLSKPLELNKLVAAVSLPPAGKLHQGAVVLSGWGSTSSSSALVLPDTLQFAVLSVVDFETCKQALENLIGLTPIDDTNVCSGPLTGGLSACNGDSGGPLIQTNALGETEVVGVVSWGIQPCGTQGAPSVYTRVSAHVDWINDNIASG